MTDRARRLNDYSLEWAILFGRFSSLANVVVLTCFLIAQRWWPALVAFVYAAVVGWLSWWVFGNSTWRKQTIRVCGKPSPGGGLICNVAITEDNMTHVGLHADGLRDPEGGQWWR